MTILPKKKSSQSKSSDVELSGESAGGNHGGGGGGGGGGVGHQVGHPVVVVGVGGIDPGCAGDRQDGRYNVGGGGGGGGVGGGGRTSPPSRMNMNDGNVEDVRGGVVTVPINANAIALGVPCNGVVSQHKRRHRASPHRNMRKHRTTGAASSCVDIIGGGAMSCDRGGPSTSSGHSVTSIGVAGCSASEGPGTVASNDSLAEDFSGYNSGDEYSQSLHMWSEEEWAERERIFEKKMRKKGLVIKKMGEDGACLFRAVADQVYGDQEMHAVVRKHCMDYMAKNADYFSQYVTEDFSGYLNRKRLDHIHGNHVEMQALCEMYNRSIEVYSYAVEPINTFHGRRTDNESIRISYHKNSHYNSIIDPYKATVGVGLGLPGFMPGLAEKNLMHDAVRQSEEFHIEQTMLEDKLKATDWEATNEAIEEQVARESYLQWLRDNERRARKATTRTATATCSSSCGGGAAGGASPDIRSPSGGRSPRGRPPPSTPSAGNSPSRDNPEGAASVNSASGPSHANDAGHHSGDGCDGKSGGGGGGGNNGNSASSDFRLLETASFMNQLPPHVFGLTEWEDADILAQVLAASQQEYLDNLKRSASSSTPPPSTSSSQHHHLGSAPSTIADSNNANLEDIMQAMES